MPKIARGDGILLTTSQFDFEIIGNRDVEMDMYLVTTPISVTVNCDSSRPHFKPARDTPDFLLSTITYRSHRMYSDQKHGNTKFYSESKLFLQQIEGEVNAEQLGSITSAATAFMAMHQPVFTHHREMGSGSLQRLFRIFGTDRHVQELQLRYWQSLKRMSNITICSQRTCSVLT